MTEDELFAHYIEIGALIPQWDEEEQDFFYMPALNVEQIAPELFQQLKDELDADLISLYEKGLVSIEYDDNLEAGFELTDLGRQYILEAYGNA